MDDLSRIIPAMVENISTERVWKPPSKRKAEGRKQKQERRGKKGREEDEELRSKAEPQSPKQGGELVIYRIKKGMDNLEIRESDEEDGTKKIDIFI